MNENDVTVETAETNTPESKQKTRFWNYAGINFTYYITMALAGFVNIFLQSIGFNAQQVGAITAINSGVGIFASPFWGMLSDKIRSVKKVIIIALIVGPILFALIPMASGIGTGITALFICIPIAMFFRQPTMALLDNWMLKNAAAEKLDYGALRAFGALSYALASIALGYILPLTGVAFTFYANAVLTLPALLLIFFSKSSAEDKGLGKKSLTFKEMRFGQLFKNYYLITYILFSIIQRIPFQCSNTFLPFLVTSVGGNTAQMGFAMGVRAFVEIPVMLLLKPLRKRMPLYVLIMIATGLFMVECFMYSFASSFGMIIVISAFHGIGNGMMITAGSSYVFSLAPENLKATSQTILGAMNSAAGIIGGLLGGALIEVIGIQDFYLIIGIMILAALAMFMLSFFIGEKVLKIKRPGLSLN